MSSGDEKLSGYDFSDRSRNSKSFRSRGRGKKFSSATRKPYFQPRQIWHLGRRSRGRMAPRLDSRRPNPNFSKGIRRGDKNRDYSRERQSERKKKRSRSRDDRVESDYDSSESPMKTGAYKSEKDDPIVIRRSKSGEHPSFDDVNSPEHKDKQSNSDRSLKIRVRRSSSLRRDSEPRDMGPKNKEDLFRSKDAGPKAKNLRSPEERSLSRGTDNRNDNNRERQGYERRSRSRGRRSTSRDRRSRSRGERRRSRSRDRRSRSRDRRYDSRERRSRSMSDKRSRRHSKSSSRSRSRSRERRRRRRSYSSSRSSSPKELQKYMGYKQKLDSLDILDFDKERLMVERSGYSGGLLNIYSGQQATQFSQSTFHPSQFQVPPPPPGVEPYSQSSSLTFPPGQPPPAPFISSQTPPAPFLSNQTSVPPQLGAPQQYAAPPPPILSQSSLPQSQYSHIPPGQTEEYSYLSSGYSNFEDTSQNEIFSSSRQVKDFGVNWNSSNHPSSSIVIYPQSGPETSNTSSKESTTVSVPKKTGVEEEKQNQKQTLLLQREQYLQKNASLQKELTRLKEQRSELLLEESPDSDRLLKENTKLQSEITKRLKAIENVVEMLSGLIKKDPLVEKEKKYTERPTSRQDYHKDSPPVSSHEVKKKFIDDKYYRRNISEERERGRMSPKRSHSPARRHNSRTKEKDMAVLETSPPPLIFPKLDRERSPPKPKVPVFESREQMKQNIPSIDLTVPPVNPNHVNLVHYDPELHWCSICHVFPRTVADYLNHLHTQNHKHQIAASKMDSSPWHADLSPEPSPPIIENAPSKRIPIRGVEFLVPSTGWYCRLCKSWIGDMHCAQEHLKGRTHTSKYAEYISQNPHWEVDWLSDRTKSFERSSEYLSRLREKEVVEPSINKDLESEKAKFSKLSDTLLAVLAQQNKRQRQNSSSSLSSNSSDDGRKKVRKSKKKKSKKKKKKDESPGRTPRNKSSDKSPHVPHYRHSNIDVDEQMQKSDVIMDWMHEDKSELPIPIKIKNKAKHESDRLPEGKSQSDRPRESKVDRYREDRGKGDEKEFRDDKYRDDRGISRNWGKGRDQQYTNDLFSARDQFRTRDQLSDRDNTNRKDFKESRDIKDKLMKEFEREEPQYKKVEPEKKNFFTQRVDEPSKFDKRKSPLRVFQRPDDPLERESPEPFEKKEKSIKNDKPQGKQESDKLPEGKSLSDRPRESTVDKHREDRGKGDEKDFRDDRSISRNWGKGRDQYTRAPFNPRDQFRTRDQLSDRDNTNRKDFKESRDIKNKLVKESEREEPQYKKVEPEKKNFFTQWADEPPKIDKRKSPLRVFQRPDDPLERESPEPFEKREKPIKSDRPQGKLWFPSKEATEELDIEEEEVVVTPPEKPLEEKTDIKKKVEVKKVTSFTIPKAKLPFIGRMPILKKKPPDLKSEEIAKDSRQEEVIEKTKGGSEKEPIFSKWDAQSSSKKPNVEPKIKPGIITDMFSPEKKTSDDFGEQDMDITNDDQDDITWVDEGQKSDLHQDFQDALDLLFPEGDGGNKQNTKENDKNIQSSNLIFRNTEGDLYAGVGPPVVDTSGPVVPPLRTESTLMLNVNTPPPMVPGNAPVRNDGPLLMTTVAPPPISHSGPHPMGPGGPPPMMRHSGPPPSGPNMMGHIGPPPSGPNMMGHHGQLGLPPGVPMGDDMNPLLTRPPPPIGHGGSLRPPMLGPGSTHLPLGHMMGPPRHMGPSMGVIDGPLMRPQGGPMGMPMQPHLYSPEEDAEEPVQKRKNAPSQRMRRHMRKKKAEAKARAEAESDLPPTAEVKTKYEGMDISDLAMLGIDEGDSIIT